MAQVEKGIEENQIQGMGVNAGGPSLHHEAQENQNLVWAGILLLSLLPAFIRSNIFGNTSRTSAHAHETSVHVEIASGPASRGSHATSSSIVDYGGNTTGGPSFQEKIQEDQNILLVVTMGILALIMQIFSFNNLPHQFLLHGVIVCATTVSMVFSLSVVFDILSGVSASSLKPSVYVSLLSLFTSFLVYITALSFHNFLLISFIYVLVAFSVFVHFTLFKIVFAFTP